LNWINTIPTEGRQYQAKFRYREKDNDVVITKLEDNLMHVKFLKPVRAVTPGQACVLYDGEVCLGGGIINEVFKDGVKRKY
jgi:tRNA-specific 2-thiouridylase